MHTPHPIDATIPQITGTPKAVLATKSLLDRWQTPDHIHMLKPLVDKAITTFAAPDLTQRLHQLKSNSDQDSKQIAPLAELLLQLSEQICMIAIGRHCQLPIQASIHQAVSQFLDVLLKEPMWSNQWRCDNPPRMADLFTVEIGTRLALASVLEPEELQADQQRLRQALWEFCWQPIETEWLSPATRQHSLNGMGHNWWSVVVGGGGLIAAWMGWEKQAQHVARVFKQWFDFADAPLSRKHRNFGQTGDFIEGTNYGQYALHAPMLLGLLRPDIAPLDQYLNASQWQGLAEFFSRTYIPTLEGYHALQFGDVGRNYKPLPEVWHTLWALTGHPRLMQLAHAVKPMPQRAIDLLGWRDLPKDAAPVTTRPWPDALAHFDNAAMTFIDHQQAQLALRAGEYWNHNHLDAGSFIFTRNKVVWVDDSGTCSYGTPDYHQHYVQARAHNIAYAPELCVTLRRMVLEGSSHLPQVLNIVHHQDISTVAVETNILSGGALARSLRWLMLLDGDVMLTFDDLGAYQATPMELLLHTRTKVQSDAQPQGITLLQDQQQCRVQTFCTSPVTFSSTPSPMDGQIAPYDKPEDKPLGQCLSWKSMPVERLYFAMVLGSDHDATWVKTADHTPGYQLVTRTGKATWTIWLNENANGKETHVIPYGTWRGFETDAYMLAIRDDGNIQTLHAWQCSVVRKDGVVLMDHLARQSHWQGNVR